MIGLPQLSELERRQTSIVAQELAQGYQERLAGTDWPAKRLAAALALVEAFAEAHTKKGGLSK